MIQALFFLLSFVFPSKVFAQGILDPCTGDPDAFPCIVANLQIGGVITQIIQFIFVIAVILALGFLVYGGIKWLTSGGDKEGVAAARGTIIAAIIGLVVIFISYVILNFVVFFLTGENISGIPIPFSLTNRNLSGGTDNSRLIQGCITGGGTPVVDNNNNYQTCRGGSSGSQNALHCQALSTAGSPSQCNNDPGCKRIMQFNGALVCIPN